MRLVEISVNGVLKQLLKRLSPLRNPTFDGQVFGARSSFVE
jgi:hypothetical protein